MTDSVFKEWSSLWEERGYKVYYALESYLLPPVKDPEDEIPTRERLAAREITELLTAEYFQAEETAIHTLGGDTGRQYLEWRNSVMYDSIHRTLEGVSLQNWPVWP